MAVCQQLENGVAQHRSENSSHINDSLYNKNTFFNTFLGMIIYIKKRNKLLDNI